MSFFEETELSEEYKDIFEEIVVILFKHDPIGISSDNNFDEYKPEAASILRRLVDARDSVIPPDAVNIVFKVFCNWFNEDKHTLVKDRKYYRSVGFSVWEAWNRFKEKEEK